MVLFLPSVSVNGGLSMLERWERIYRVFFYGLLAAVAVLVLWKLIPVLWDVLVNGGWRPRAAFTLLIGYYATMRLVARTTRFHAFVMYWHMRSLLHVICFNLLFLVLPLAVVLYLAPVRNPPLLLVSIGLILVLAAVIEWKARPTSS
jgi:hypothetical protein